MFNISKDVYVCSVYIPPENSKYFNPDFLDDFETDVLAFSSMGHVILWMISTPEQLHMQNLFRTNEKSLYRVITQIMTVN